MPYIKVLQDQMEGCTAESIRQCLRFLYNEPSFSRTERYKVSIVFGRGTGRVSLGDDLELANPHTNKMRKKRWWEHVKKSTDQLRLPFPSYQPADVLGMSEDRYGDEFDLRIQYKRDDATVCRTTTKFSVRRGLRGGRHDIKAIKIHRVMKHWVADLEETVDGEEIHDISIPFHTYEAPRRQFVPTREQCISLLSRAVQNGLIVTRTQVVYDKETRERIGHDIILDRDVQHTPPQSAEMYHPPRHYRCSMRMADGENYAFLIIASDVEFIESDSCPPSPISVPGLSWAREGCLSQVREGFRHGGLLNEASYDYAPLRRRLERISDELPNSNYQEPRDEESLYQEQGDEESQTTW